MRKPNNWSSEGINKCKDRHISNQEYEQCPFFIRDRGHIVTKSQDYYAVNCEGCSLKFPDKVSKRNFIYKLCAHPVDYKNCAMYITLYDYYNRLYNERKE